MATIEEILELEQLERDIFRGQAHESYLQRTFGGQVAAQALVSATRTVSPEFHVHSLHGYFLRPGIPDRPAVYLVERLRDGRSFVTRRITGIQNGEAIFSMSASFHIGNEGIEHQDTMPTVPPADSIPDPLEDPDLPKTGVVREWENFDIRRIPNEEFVTDPLLASQQRVWFRYRHTLPDDNVFHVCTLAYMSDMTLLGSAKAAHPGVDVQEASLDHAMWFMRPFRADEWLLYDQTSPFAGSGRALTQGRIFDTTGRLVAAVTQEGLTRTGRSGAPLRQDDRR